MLIIHVGKINVNNPFKEYYDAVEDLMEIKPSCSLCYGNFKKNGTYKRFILIKDTPIHFRIQRIVCKRCGKSHTLLPCFLLPFSKTHSAKREIALRRYGEGVPIEKIAESLNITPRTVSRWCKQLKPQINAIITWVAKKLATHSAEVNWLEGTVLRGRKRVVWLFKLLDRFQENFFPEHTTGVLSLLNFLSPGLVR